MFKYILLHNLWACLYQQFSVVTLTTRRAPSRDEKVYEAYHQPDNQNGREKKKHFRRRKKETQKLVQDESETQTTEKAHPFDHILNGWHLTGWDGGNEKERERRAKQLTPSNRWLSHWNRKLLRQCGHGHWDENHAHKLRAKLQLTPDCLNYVNEPVFFFSSKI